MVSRLELDVMGRVEAAMQRDPSTMTSAELVQAIQDNEVVVNRWRLWLGEILAAMHNRGMSWPEIARRCEMPQTTAYATYRSYIAHRDE